MATRPRIFSPKFYYHIYNRGVEKRDIFETPGDYNRFMDIMLFYLHKQSIRYTHYQELNEDAKRVYNKLHPTGVETLRVKLLAFCLMPNHFHLVLKPVTPSGVTRFLSDISNSHTRYFNTRRDRVGKLYQGPFRSKEIRSEPSLLQVIRYLHLNPVNSTKTNLSGNLLPENYPYSSYNAWIGKHPPHPTGVVDHEEIQKWVAYMGGVDAYKSFVEAKIGRMSAAGIEDLILEIAEPPISDTRRV